MVRNTIKSDFRLSKMAAGGHFVNKIQRNQVAYWSEMTRNAIESDSRSSKMEWKKKNKKKINCVWRICVRLGMSIHLITLVVWCLYRVHTALQRDLLCRNSFNIFSSPYGWTWTSKSSYCRSPPSPVSPLLDIVYKVLATLCHQYLGLWGLFFIYL